MPEYFRPDNTEGYTLGELRRLNERVAEILAEMGDQGEDDPLHENNVKNAGDQAHNEFDQAATQSPR